MSQDKKDSGKVRGQLPSGWSKLDLTPAQKEEVYKLNAEYKAKTEKLEEEISRLRSELARKRVAVLTDDQRKKLADLVTGGEPVKERAKEKAKTTDPAK